MEELKFLEEQQVAPELIKRVAPSLSTGQTWPRKRERFSTSSVSDAPVGMKYSVIAPTPFG